MYCKDCEYILKSNYYEGKYICLNPFTEINFVTPNTFCPLHKKIS